VRDDAPERIGSVGERLSAALQLHPSEFISDVAATMETRASRVFRYSKPRDFLPGGRHTPASQFAAFYPGLAKVEAFLRDIDAEATLVRDDDRHFGAFLDLAFSTAKSLRPSLAAAAYAASPVARILACASANSEAEVGVQLADLAAGTFGRAVRGALRGRTSDAATRRPVEGWRGVLLGKEQHYWAVSDARCPEVLRAVYGERVA
ncbi:MAG TPA: DUF3800 domain-containing protein, partial [Polyangiaceae bacterium]|nr:DUF3800 domain-containing protein [Polyangiaceae bacterium]